MYIKSRDFPTKQTSTAVVDLRHLKVEVAE